MTQRIDETFLIRPGDLSLRFAYPAAQRTLSYSHFEGSPAKWKTQCRARLADLLGLPADVADPGAGGLAAGAVRALRETKVGDVAVNALVMDLDGGLSIPAYLLQPSEGKARGAVMAIHGHGEAPPCLGLRDDYHHAFALRLAQAGFTVLLPELRGFGVLSDLALQTEGERLDYWQWGRHMAYSLVTHGFLYGRTLIGDTVLDLLRWEAWLANALNLTELDVAGISYGGDLALIYPAFSCRVRRIFAGGTLGSFSVIFARCYNAPAHCIPGVLQWMDRSDIAGLNAPRPLALHYGELDTPGPDNHSASYNETVPGALQDLRAIYAAFDAPDAVRLIVSEGRKHEMDIEALVEFLSGQEQK